MSALTSKDLLQSILASNIENDLDSWLSEKAHVAGQYESVRINKTAHDISSFLDQLAICINGIIDQHKNPSFFHQHRNEFFKAKETIRKINEFLQAAFIFTETLHGDETAFFQKVTLQAMDTMKLVTNTEKKAEKGTLLIEFGEMIIAELEKEIFHCKSRLSHLKKTPLPALLANELPIDSLSEYVSSASILSTQELFGGSSNLLAFTETEKAFLEEIGSLESRLDPLQISVEMLKFKVGDLDGLQGGFEVECERVQIDSVKLEENWNALLSEFILLKNNTVGARIVSVCYYLNTRVFAMIEQSLEWAKFQEIDEEEIARNVKTCSAVINLISRIIISGVPGIQACASQYNQEISPKWIRLNEMLQDKKKAVSENSRTTFIQAPEDRSEISLRVLKTIKSRTPSAEVTRELGSCATNRNSLGLGINLHIGVEPSPSVPYSISKMDRIVDLGVENTYLSRSNIQLALLQSAEEDRSMGYPLQKDDIRSSLPNTPAMFSLQSPSQINDSITTETTPFYRIDNHDKEIISQKNIISTLSKEEKRNTLRDLRKHSMIPSRLPTMVAGWSSLKLPVLRKEYKSSHGPSQIPTISPDNEVFCSPERRSGNGRSALDRPDTQLQKTASLKAGLNDLDSLRSPPAFLIAHEKNANRRRKSGVTNTRALSDVTNVRASLNAPAGKFSLNGLETPNLAFPQVNDAGPMRSMSWRSTSPERPGSPMGSRYDDQHLTPPLQYAKKPWK